MRVFKTFIDTYEVKYAKDWRQNTFGFTFGTKLEISGSIGELLVTEMFGFTWWII